MLVLLGILIVIAGFMRGYNPFLVVALSAIVTGLAAGLGPFEVVATLGRAFASNRFVSIAWVMLPVIGLLERAGIRERARALIGGVRALSTGRLLILYLFARQVTAAIGLTALGGHVQMVRPLLAPMAEAAAERNGAIDDETRERIRAHCAAADNIGVFFGEDIFIAIGSILLIQGVLRQYHVFVSPLAISVWAIPTAIVAFVVHGTRLLLLDRELSRKQGAAA